MLVRKQKKRRNRSSADLLKGEEVKLALQVEVPIERMEAPLWYGGEKCGDVVLSPQLYFRQK